ncbi:probable E3 ubiquitin-protein ligase RHA4A isoform X2 [Coffea arabica]|uniref:Probable E3 ubiquitin-protein ligase RHA4A isoform X2 n=1 Tax=Coffea arabica TaxID=13443 RepID=A0ABM4VFT5_COFAR
MGFDPQSPSPSHFYSQELQLKLYQAFIFSIPILFSIILFLLFYLFYLKKRVSTISSPSANLTESSNQAALVHSSGTDVEILKEKLPVILFDEHSKAKERLCSVVISTKNSNPEPPASGNNLPTPDAQNSNQSPRVFYAEQQEQLSIVVTDVEDFTGEHRIVPKEGSSGSSDSVCIDNEQTNLHAESVIIRVQGSNT